MSFASYLSCLLITPNNCMFLTSTDEKSRYNCHQSQTQPLQLYLVNKWAEGSLSAFNHENTKRTPPLCWHTLHVSLYSALWPVPWIIMWQSFDLPLKCSWATVRYSVTFIFLLLKLNTCICVWMPWKLNWQLYTLEKWDHLNIWHTSTLTNNSNVCDSSLSRNHDR